MRRRWMLTGALGAGALAAIATWRRNRRIGAAYVNRVVDPWLVRHGMIERTHGEIGLLEHVGRRSGVVRIAPVRPVPTETGFRIVVPLGLESQWAQNVLAAGHCRIEVGGSVHELDEPRLIPATEVPEVPLMLGHLLGWLGFRYLVLHRFDRHPGTLTEPGGDAAAPAAEPTPAGPEPGERTRGSVPAIAG